MNDSNLKYQWQLPYREALTELDRNRLAAKIVQAESVIRERLQALEALQALDHDAHNHEEVQALEDAISSLRVLKVRPQLVA
jgi:hypothetical protein